MMLTGGFLLGLALHSIWFTPPPPGVPADSIVFHRPHLSLGVEVRVLPVGTAQDPVGKEGTAWITSELLRGDVSAALTQLPHRLEVAATPWYTLLVIQTAPESLATASRLVDRILSGPPPTQFQLDLMKERIIGQLDFQEGSPVEAFRREVDRLLLGSGHPGARPAHGTVHSLPTIDLEDVEALWREAKAPLIPVFRLLPSSTSGSKAAMEGTPAPGPILAPGQGSAVAQGFGWVNALGETPRPLWTEADRLRIIRPITNGWVTVAYPLPDELPPGGAETLAGVLREQLTPSPPDPTLFRLDAELRDTPRGRALLLTATVAPDGVDRWEGRILEAVEKLAEGGVPEAFLHSLLRRQRARSLLDETPAAWLTARALEALRTGTLQGGSIHPEAHHVREWARALGPPRILVYGPDLE
ncbi:MAG: hypothetical protein WEA09_03055 [Gemmatimonadota bacterium]